MEGTRREAQEMSDEPERIEGETYDPEGTVEALSSGQNLDGRIRISEDVIAQIAVKALSSVDGVQTASPGLMANLRLGRRANNGVRIAVSEGPSPEIQVDTYISIKYGLRIPDICWDVQEIVKNDVERYTGYVVKGVNVFVQGITFGDRKAAEGTPETPADFAEEV
jgi:uncharacterized alkaline shock family protein YloU